LWIDEGRYGETEAVAAGFHRYGGLTGYATRLRMSASTPSRIRARPNAKSPSGS
jgi:hypothetical protein